MECLFHFAKTLLVCEETWGERETAWHYLSNFKLYIYFLTINDTPISFEPTVALLNIYLTD